MLIHAKWKLLLIASALFSLPLLAQYPQGNNDPIAKVIAEASEKETPRTQAGHPDLTAYWKTPRAGGAGFFSPPPADENSGIVQVFPQFATVANVNANDISNAQRRWENKSLRPKYKPQYQKIADENYWQGDLNDPTYACGLPGVPRVGRPAEIVQSDHAVYLLYEDLVNRFRVVPTDGRELDPDDENLPNGQSVGYWEGDTLVVETQNISDDTWLDKDGSMHSTEMVVYEYFTRKGDTLTYKVRVEDPVMFAEPFEKAAETFIAGDSSEHIVYEWPCIEESRDKMVGTQKH